MDLAPCDGDRAVLVVSPMGTALFAWYAVQVIKVSTSYNFDLTIHKSL